MSAYDRGGFTFYPHGGSYCEACNSIANAPFLSRDHYAICVPCVLAAYNAIPDELKAPKGETSQSVAVTADPPPPPQVQAVAAQADAQTTVQPIRAPRRRDVGDDKPHRKRKTKRRGTVRK